jgi:hypothetical protein
VPKRLFYSYSSKDESLRAELETHLSSLRRDGVIEPWSFRKISPGEEWDAAIAKELDRADIVLLLVSADFLNSDYCWGIEVKRALERHARGEAVVVPVILRPCDWQTQDFARLQALPSGAKPVVKRRLRDDAWTDVVQGVRRVAEQLKRDKPMEDRSSGAGTTSTSITHEQVARSRIQSIAEMFTEGNLKARQLAAQEVERLATALSIPVVLELSVSKAVGERVAAGIALREHLLINPLLVDDAKVVNAVRLRLQDDHPRVRYRFVRAVTTHATLAMQTVDILRWIQTTERDKALRAAAVEALEKAAEAS